jgi:hypothetical protein
MIRISSSRAAFLLLLALLTSSIASGLEAQTSPGHKENPGASPDSAGAALDEVETKAATPQIAEDPASVEKSPDDTSPYDYQSSEEISEDRSVSFPVDI